jgi:multiple sugar transport system permease protein
MTDTRRRARLVDIAIYALLIVAIVIWSVPVIWVVMTSLKPRTLIFNNPPTLLFLPTLRNYIEALETGGIVKSIVNSTVISVFSTLLAMLIAVPAAYAYARLKFRGRTTLTFYTLLMQMAPPMGLLIPFYYALSELDLLDTYVGLIAIYLTITIPFMFKLLVGMGQPVPEGMLDHIFSDLEQRGLVRGGNARSREAIATHGGRVITWINPTVI